MALVNWIPDTNRFKLPTPPDWFLQRLYDFDPMLVIVPSRVKAKGVAPAYLLCRRRQYSAGLGDVAMLDNKHPDTNLCYAHGIVPIGPLRFNKKANMFTETACASLLADLRARDTWALSGGPDKSPDAVWQAIEAQERAQEMKDAVNLRDKFYHMARDAYRSLKARTGQRNKRASDFHGVAPQPPTKQRVTLTDAS